MKKILSKFVRPLLAIAALALVVFAGSSIVSAWTGPTGAFPTGNVAAPVNTGTVGQTKQGDFASNKNIVSVGMTLSNSLVGGTRASFGCTGTGLGLLGCYLANNDIANTDKFRAGFFNPSGILSKGIAIDAAGSLFVKDGNEAAAKVLTSDATGKATWQAPAAAPDPITTVPLYKKNPACSASDTIGGSVSTSDKCYADACVKFNGSPASSFAQPYPVCIPVSGGNFAFPSGTPSTAPYGCRPAGGLSVSGLPTTDNQGTCSNIQIGSYVGVATTTTTSGGLTWTVASGQGSAGQTCAAWLGVPANQGRIRLKIGTNVVYTDQCIYSNGSTTSRHDPAWTASGWYPKSPASMSGQAYTTEKAI